MCAGLINLLITYDRHILCLALREENCGKLVKEVSRGSLDTIGNAHFILYTNEYVIWQYWISNVICQNRYIISRLATYLLK
jgi:hypothetical protein